MCQNVTTVERRTIALCKQRHEGAADGEEGRTTAERQMKFNNTNKAIELETRANEARRTRGEGEGEGEGRLAQAYNKSINEESMGKDGARRRRGSSSSSVLTVRLVGSKGHRAHGTGLRILGSLYLLFTVPAGRACKGCATLRMNHDEEREREMETEWGRERRGSAGLAVGAGRGRGGKGTGNGTRLKSFN